MKTKWLLILIIIVAAVLRLYHLNSNPSSLNWDEAAIGWNAKTIFHTRRDEYGTRLPLSFKSFGDYKAPVYIYLTAPIVGLFGTNPISVRLVSVLAGIASVLLIYLLIKQLPITDYRLPITASLLLAISPWHVLLSRPAFEPNLALFFILLGTYLFLKSLVKPKYLILSVLSFTLSIYTYQSPKIFVPVFLLGLAVIFRQQLFSLKLKKWLIVSVVLSLFLLTPLVKEMVLKNSASRFQGTSIFYNQQGEKQPYKFSLITQIFKNYIIHYSPSYLFFGSNFMPRLQLKTVGPLLLIEAPFLAIGLIYLLKNKRKIWAQFLLWWLIIGPLPAMIGREVPHPIRSYNLLPALVVITALGITKTKFLFKPTIKILLIILFSLNTVYFIYHYFVTYPVYSAPDWQYGYKQAVIFAKENEDSVEKILISSHYGQPYIFTLFYQDRDSQAVFWGALSKYLFRDLKWPEDEKLTSTLLIGSPQEIPINTPGIIKEILFPDGQVAFRIVKTL